MKVALLSFVENLNYGGSLQAYALEKAIESRYSDIQCEYIRYHKNQFAATVKWMARKITSKISNSDDTPSWTIKEYMGIVWDSVSQAASKKGRNNINLFNEFWKLSNYSESFSKKQLKKQDHYDLYIVGSDQVWNCGRLDLDTTYLLDFVKDDEKKASYAPSFALKKIPNKYYSKYHQLWSRFKWLSCREKSGADIISACTGREVIDVLDPVFLLSKKQWEEVERTPHNISIDARFLLLYTLADDKDYMPYLEKFLQKNHLKLISISGDITKFDMTGPAEWLWYFHNAEYVVTDSFHGTAFSVIFERQFYSFIPHEQFFKSSSDRIVDLLNMLGLQKRVVRNRSELFSLPSIDYKEVQKSLNTKKKKSFEYLDRVIING